MKKNYMFLIVFVFGVLTFSITDVKASGSVTLGLKGDAASSYTTNFGDLKEGTKDLGVAGAGESADGSLINIIKNFINWVLGILGLIALIVLLRGGFQMVTAAGDEEKYKSGFKILKQAAIGLAFIGISFFVVSMIFFVLSAVGGGAS